MQREGAVLFIEEAQSNGCSLTQACKDVGTTIRTYERWKNNPIGDKRKGPITSPANKLNPEERAEVIKIATSEKYRDKSPDKIVPSLADEGRFVASESTFFRILKAENLNAHRGKSKPKTKSKPKEHIATAPNQVWSWDITYLSSTVRGIFFYLYLVMDIYSRKIIGYRLSDVQNSEISAEMIDKLCLQEGIKKGQLVLHSDNGGPMKASTILAMLQKLGVMPSFSRPHVCDDNPFSEALFKTVKYCPFFPSKPFESIEAAIAWVEQFIYWHNNEHLHSSIKYVTPASRHSGLDEEILKKRNAVYENAKTKHSNRWSGNTRNWKKDEIVYLNKLHHGKIGDTKMVA